MQGKIYVISGPSGIGKDSICNEIVKNNENFELSVSMTTRNPRFNEREGVDYYFVSNEEFENKIRANDFIEYTEIYGNKYGTPKSELNKKLEAGVNVLMVLDPQGALNIKREYPDSTIIYLLPPSLEELKQRLKGRNTESEEDINKRFNNCINEMQNSKNYDYCITADTIPNAAEKFLNIVEDKYMDNELKNTIVVNMLAGPGAGKTQSAWSIAAGLKAKGVIVEYVPEYAKELVWDERFDLCDGSYKNELNIYNEQKHRIDRLIGKVDVIITDRPLILSNLYIDERKNNINDFQSYVEMVKEDFSNYNNKNFFIERSKDYVQAGRMQTENEAKALDLKLLDFLNENDIHYEAFNINNIDKIVEDISTEIVKNTLNNISDDVIVSEFQPEKGCKVYNFDDEEFEM